MKISKILGPSPMKYAFKKAGKVLFVKGGHQDIIDDNICISDEIFFETYIEPKTKPRRMRMSNKELLGLYDSKVKLSKDQKLVKSVLDDWIANTASGIVSEKAFANTKNLYMFRRKYRRYLRIKRFVPLVLVAPFTGSELSKMAYAAALDSKSVSLTLPGLIGYSLPGFFFFHISYFYAPDKLKPICTFCKYTVGAPFWVIHCMTDEVLSSPEEAFFGEPVPIDVTQTGGTIPADIGDWDKLRDVLHDMRKWSEKSY